MKINSTNWNVANTENLYKNFQQKYLKKQQVLKDGQAVFQNAAII